MASFIDQSGECKLTVSTGNAGGWEVGALVRSQIVTDGKTAWQLGMVRVGDADPGGVGKIECFVELVKMGEADGQPKFARLLGSDIQSCPLPTLFEHTGQRSKPTTFACQLDVGIQFTIEVTTAEKEPLSTERTAVVTNLISWFQQEDFGDLTLVVAGDGKRFHCHQRCLAYYSPLFAQMYGRSVTEEEERSKKRSNHIFTINSYDSEIVQQLLLFVYLDHCELGPTAERLLAAAQEYQIDRLKVLCEVGLTADRLYANATAHHYNNLDEFKVVCKSVESVNLCWKDLEKAYSVATMYHVDVLLAALAKAESLAANDKNDEVPVREVARWKKRNLKTEDNLSLAEIEFMCDFPEALPVGDIPLEDVVVKNEEEGGEAVEKEMSQMMLN